MTTTVPPEIAVLLPAADESPRCAEFSASNSFAPQGTGLDVAMVVLAEVPLPWPKPVFAHQRLDGLTNMVDTPVGRARIFATHPTGSNDDRATVTCWWRDGARVASAVLAPSHDELRVCLSELTAVAPDESSFLADEPAPERAVAVCTQGSHDVCCGSAGTRLAAELELTRPDVRVYRISHTGGHRFAPTALTLPDGRTWAYLDTATVEAIIDRQGSPADVADRCRGWWGAPGGAGQVAEVAAFARHGWDREDVLRTVEVTPTGDDGSARCTVRAGDDTDTVEVTVARMVPTITCRAAGGLPAKSAPEFRATVVD